MAIAIDTRYSTDLKSPHFCEDQERNTRRLFDRLGFDHHAVEVFNEPAEWLHQVRPPGFRGAIVEVTCEIGADEAAPKLERQIS